MTSTAPQATAAAAKSTPMPGSKPGEPPFQMKIEPDKYLNIKWKPTSVTAEVKIENTLKSRQTFKIKCTDNDIFRVRPPLGFIDAGETAKIRITCTSKTLPENDRHLFAIYHMKSDEDKKTARQVWTTDSKPEGVTRIVVVFEGESGEKDEKKEEKKDEKKDDKELKKEAEKDEKKPDGEKKESKEEEEKKEEKKDDKDKKDEQMEGKKEEEKKDEKMEEEKDEKKEEKKDEKKEDKKDDAKKDDENEAKEE